MDITSKSIRCKIVYSLILAFITSCLASIDDISNGQPEDDEDPCPSCVVKKGDTNVKIDLIEVMPDLQNEDIRKKALQKKKLELTHKDIAIKVPIKIENNKWKIHVVMSCTIAAAVEIIIVIFIFLYWRQIRWALHKISCPCHSHSSHQAMEPSRNHHAHEIIEVRGLDITQEMLTYAIPRNSRQSNSVETQQIMSELYSIESSNV